MNGDRLLVGLTFVGSALWWWPLCLEPSLDLPAWTVLVLAVVCSGSATILSGGRWLRFVGACTAGAFAGTFSGLAIFPPSDPIAASYDGIVVLVATAAVFAVSIVAGLLLRRVRVEKKTYRRIAWIALVCVSAVGPVTLAITPPLAALMIRHNDQAASERFTALKKAAEQTAVQAGSPDLICDGEALKRNYKGPQFSANDWKYIAGNYVREDGYKFGIWCHQQGGYTIDVVPARGKSDGTRRFCADESGKVGCGSEWIPYREACAPCTK